MEEKVFPVREVRQELGRMVFVKLFIDKPAPEGPANKKLRNDVYQSNDLPLYIILDRDGKEIARLDYAELRTEKFLEFLRRAWPQ